MSPQNVMMTTTMRVVRYVIVGGYFSQICQLYVVSICRCRQRLHPDWTCNVHRTRAGMRGVLGLSTTMPTLQGIFTTQSAGEISPPALLLAHQPFLIANAHQRFALFNYIRSGWATCRNRDLRGLLRCLTIRGWISHSYLPWGASYRPIHIA